MSKWYALFFFVIQVDFNLILKMCETGFNFFRIWQKLKQNRPQKSDFCINVETVLKVKGIDQ